MKSGLHDLTCPSAPCARGATILGAMGETGELSYLLTEMQGDKGFVETAQAQATPPEARMRLAAPCQKTGCAQWTGEGCGVVLRVLSAIDAQGGLPDPPLQPCVIRATCRWFEERGSAACGACKYMITDQPAFHASE